LVQPRRQFMREGTVTTIEKTIGISTNKQRKFFLFSDCFILAEEQSKDKFKPLNTLMLKDTSFQDNPSQKQFGLSSGQVKLTFQAEDKSDLPTKLKELIQAANLAGKVFGVPLATVLANEKSVDGIPMVVKTITNFLKLRKQTEGLFRISAGSEEVAQLKAQFNKVEDVNKPPNLNNVNPHAAAGTLKMFFRELPEPLLTFDCYKLLINAPLDVQSMKTLLQNIPQPNQKLMKYLSNFVCSIASYENVNKMGLSNLAIVFGPNLIYAREETLENILAIPKLNSSVRFIFEHHAEIFD